MAVKTARKTRVSSWDATFVQCDLDKATKEQVKSWDPKFTATFDGLDRLVSDGYKVSFSPDKYHDCVGAFCTVSDPGHKNHGQCLTARGPDWLNAAKVLVYKHFTILQEDWKTEVGQERTRDSWG